MNLALDFFDFFTKSDFQMTTLLFAGMLILLFFILLFYTPLLSKIFFPAFGYKKYGDYLPFDKVLNDNATVRLKDGSVIRGFAIGGSQDGMLDDAARQRLFEIKQTLFNQIKDTGATLRFYTIRSKTFYDDDYEFDQPVLQRIYNKWKKQGLKIFDNRNYMVLGVSGQNAEDRMTNHTNAILSILSVYNVRLLKHNDPDNIASLFAKILSPVSKPTVSKPSENMNALISSDNIEFLPAGLIKYSFGGDAKYASIMSVQLAPDAIDSEFFKAVFGIQCEITAMNAFTIHNAVGIDRLLRQKRSSESSNQNSENIVSEQIEQAQIQIDENMTGNQIFVNFYPMFALFGNTAAEVENNISEMKKVAAAFGITPVVETLASKVSFFSLMPGFDDFPRGFNILSGPASASLPLDSIPGGVENSDWGKGPIVVFPTSAGTPYRFQFHVSDQPGAVGHTLVIGPTGGGKTTLFSFLIAQSMRHPKLKAFFFDRNRGAEIFTLACGGKYVCLENRGQNVDKITAAFNAKLNPLKMENNEQNRAFLRRWLSLLTNATAPDDLDEIARAVSVNFDYLDDADKLLKNLHVACFSSGGNVRAALKKWVDPLQYGNVFNEKTDTLDLFSRLTTFDFTEVLNDAMLAPAVISYILHRINSIAATNGAPALIMIDETAPMLENQMFRDHFIAGLQEGRKNRQCYMAAFQRANILDKLAIGDVVRGQAQTVIFFRNPAASADDYKYWKLNPAEMAFIKGTLYPNLRRAVLLSRPITGESVILNTELGGLGNLLKLFESGRPSVLLAEDLYRQFGSNFVDEYLKQTEVNE
jgi:type IV secretion system protein VirB4